MVSYNQPKQVSLNLSSLPLLKLGQEYQLSAWVGSLQNKAVTYENVQALEGYKPYVYGTKRTRCDKFTKAIQTTILRACWELLEADKTILAVSLRLRGKKYSWWRVAIWTYEPYLEKNFSYTDIKIDLINITK